MRTIERLGPAVAEFERIGNLLSKWVGSLFDKQNSAIAAALQSEQLAEQAMGERDVA